MVAGSSVSDEIWHAVLMQNGLLLAHLASTNTIHRLSDVVFVFVVSDC